MNSLKAQLKQWQKIKQQQEMNAIEGEEKIMAKRKGIMLAYPWTDKRQGRLPETILVQPKLRGIRCRVEWFKNNPILLSSSAKILEGLDHIKTVLAYLPEHLQFNFDGEIYKHGWSQERINSSALRKVNLDNPNTKNLQYHIFDLNEEGQQVGRLNGITAAIKHLIVNTSCQREILVPVKTSTLNKSDIFNATSWYVDKGYEGIIIRYPNNVYVEKRSTSVIKLKPTETDEYIIVGLENAIDKNGTPKNMVGAFQVKDADGNVFKVGAGKLTHKQRIKYWVDWELLIGETLIVKHELLRTKNNIPVCAVALEIK